VIDAEITREITHGLIDQRSQSLGVTSSAQIDGDGAAFCGRGIESASHSRLLTIAADASFYVAVL